ncbi:hypothetical protein Scep_013844 [Stephania cephalantha]|uniref:Uncharacterized protein n=1 Tax=Stephania cephalantha TaxID=152367 RepID=A0AAP0J1Z9_9MAGN
MVVVITSVQDGQVDRNDASLCFSPHTMSLLAIEPPDYMRYSFDTTIIGGSSNYLVASQTGGKAFLLSRSMRRLSRLDCITIMVDMGQYYAPKVFEEMLHRDLVPLTTMDLSLIALMHMEQWTILVAKRISIYHLLGSSILFMTKIYTSKFLLVESNILTLNWVVISDAVGYYSNAKYTCGAIV